MSEERETPAGSPAPEAPAGSPAEATPASTPAPEAQAGAPVEEAVPTETEVLAALDRAAEPPLDPAPEAVAPVAPATPVFPVAGEPAPVERPLIAEPEDLPSAGPSSVPADLPSAAPTDQPAVVPVVAPAAVPEGQLLISADHPMAALYMQTPMPPDLRGNRGAGVLISLLATLGFALVYAGVLALWRAPFFPPSTFLELGLLPWILSWGFLAACAAFFVGMVVLVLIFGRAGWWAYIFGGVLVGVLVWGASVVGYAYTAHVMGEEIRLAPMDLVSDFGLIFPVIAAALVAREAAMWFGAWIGARGRRVSRRNAEAIAEYEASLAEVQAKRP